MFSKQVYIIYSQDEKPLVGGNSGETDEELSKGRAMNYNVMLRFKIIPFSWNNDILLN